MELLDHITGEVVKERFNRNFATPVAMEQEPGDPHTLTEMAYVPPKAQIEDMLAAGRRLDAARRERFGALSPQEEEDQEVGVTQGMDLVDVQRAATALSDRLAGQETEAALKAAKEEGDAKEKAFVAAVEAEVQKRVQAAVKPPDAH